MNNPEENTSSFSEEDISSILEDNGVQNMPSDNTESSIPSEGTAPSTPPEEQEEKLPLNSPTLLIDESTSRFSGTEWFRAIQETKIILAGLGGIGSNVAFQLARMNPQKIVLYDDDIVERVNMAGQLYSTSDIGNSKVSTMANKINLYNSNANVYAIKQKFTHDSEAGDIMICGFDNMGARYTFYNSWVKHLEGKSLEDKTKCLFLDGRLSIDTLQILCIRGDDEYNIKRYRRDFLFPDSQAEPTVCSMKQTTYLACMIGSLMVNLFTNFVANTLNPIIPYDLPFFTNYDAQNMIFNTEH